MAGFSLLNSLIKPNKENWIKNKYSCLLSSLKLRIKNNTFCDTPIFARHSFGKACSILATQYLFISALGEFLKVAIMQSHIWAICLRICPQFRKIYAIGKEFFYVMYCLKFIKFLYNLSNLRKISNQKILSMQKNSLFNSLRPSHLATLSP